ncbi:hypothetical protein [Vibrio sonorensis]|uniref:hypothetical protein n=1 Tax=Vibrio sonorensis TaxID=1004316 RepID=UPI0008D939C8|nr:hypothetical protein [Vibrio sonorensis]
MKVEQGWLPEQTDQAVELYEQAFGRKLAVAIPARSKRLALLREVMDPDYAFTINLEGQLVAMVGYQNKQGGLTARFTLGALISHLGCLRGIRA